MSKPKSRRIKKLLWFVIAAVLMVGLLLTFHFVNRTSLPEFTIEGDLTDDDIRQIKALVTKLTNDPILHIEVKRPSLVEVRTGVVRGPLDGNGDFYDFEKKDGKWVRINENRHHSWIS